MNIEVKILDEKNIKIWDLFVDESLNGTLFHKQQFLEYHQSNKFKKRFDLMIYKNNKLFALLPGGITEQNENRNFQSPFGASFGGIVFKKYVCYNDIDNVVKKIIEFCRENKIDEILISNSPVIYSESLNETIENSLFQNGFEYSKKEIESIVGLNKNSVGFSKFSSKKKRLGKKTNQDVLGEKVRVDFNAPIEDFWTLLEITFDKLKTTPTHTKDEWNWLSNNLPNHFQNIILYFDDLPVAGIGIIYPKKNISLAFYICFDHNYKENHFLSYLFDKYYDFLISKNCKYFDLGTSSNNGIPRDNILMFKENIGAINISRNLMRLVL